MKNKIQKRIDPNKPVGKLKVIPDFLPPPEMLLPKEDMVKITLAIDSNTIDIFKKMAEKNEEKYQRMMREVLKGYAKKYGP